MDWLYLNVVLLLLCFFKKGFFYYSEEVGFGYWIWNFKEEYIYFNKNENVIKYSLMFKFCNIYFVFFIMLVVLDMFLFMLLIVYFWYGYVLRIFKNNDIKYIILLILLSFNIGFIL